MDTSWLSALPLPFLQYEFMRNAFLGILLIAPLFGLSGTLVVSNRLSFYSDALGHSALAGIAIGTLLGLNDPIAALVVFRSCLAWRSPLSKTGDGLRPTQSWVFFLLRPLPWASPFSPGVGDLPNTIAIWSVICFRSSPAIWSF